MLLKYALSFGNSESDFPDCGLPHSLRKIEAAKPQWPAPRARHRWATSATLENSQPAATQQVRCATTPRVTSRVSKERWSALSYSHRFTPPPPKRFGETKRFHLQPARKLLAAAAAPTPRGAAFGEAGTPSSALGMYLAFQFQRHYRSDEVVLADEALSPDGARDEALPSQSWNLSSACISNDTNPRKPRHS